MADINIDLAVFDNLQRNLVFLRFAKPDDRSEKARRYAVTITELEKVAAYFKTYVMDEQ